MKTPQKSQPGNAFPSGDQAIDQVRVYRWECNACNQAGPFRSRPSEGIRPAITAHAAASPRCLRINGLKVS